MGEEIYATQHVPGFVGSEGGKSAVAPTITDLLAVPWIAHWMRNDLLTSTGEEVATLAFHRWSLADRGSDRQMLMAEYDRGARWYVIAFVRSAAPIALPDWQPPSVHDHAVALATDDRRELPFVEKLADALRHLLSRNS